MRTCQKFPVLRNAETENRKLRKQTKGRIRSLDERRGERVFLFSFLFGTRPGQASAPLSPGTTGGRNTNALLLLLLSLSLSSEVSATIPSLSLPLNSSFLGWVISLFLVARPILALWFRVLRLMDCQSPVVGLLAVILGPESRDCSVGKILIFSLVLVLDKMHG